MGHRGNACSSAAVAVTVLLVALAGHARADEGEDQALLHIDRGVAAFHAREYTRAHREFEAAHQLVPDRANPYRWLALTEMQLGDCAQAVGNIAEFEKRVPAEDARLAELIRLRVLCEREKSEPAPPPAPAPARARPLTSRPWFWAAVGGVTVVVAGGILAGMALGGDDVARLPPVQCGNTGCTP